MSESNLESEFQALHEIIKRARQVLPRQIYDYMQGGAESETTVKRNRAALDRIALRPRVLTDVSKIDPSTEFLGARCRIPVALAPVGSLESFDPGGGATVMKAAERRGVIGIISSVNTIGLEGIAQAAGGPKIFQLYVRGDRAWIDDIARRAVDAGYIAFCLTVDTQVYSRRERDLANRFVKSWRTRAVGLEHQAALSWDYVKHFKDTFSIPLILKGIATAEDAEIACEHGVDVVYVSNHGGRQLDHGRGSMDVLPEVLEAVKGRARVMIDGGFMRGTDVVKAIAMGADLVAIGRLMCCGLAAGGQAGLERTLDLLEDELRVALGLLGAPTLGSLTKRHLHPGEMVTLPHFTSAFPHLAADDYRY